MTIWVFLVFGAFFGLSFWILNNEPDYSGELYASVPLAIGMLFLFPVWDAYYGSAVALGFSLALVKRFCCRKWPF